MAVASKKKKEDLSIYAVSLFDDVVAALEVGRALVERFGSSDMSSERRGDLHVVLARAALAAGDTNGAEEHVVRARAAGHAGDDARGGHTVALDARIDAVAAHVALERARLDDAAELARAAVGAAASSGQPEVECEACEVLGRVARWVDRDEAIRWFERAAEVAAVHHLEGWHLRARHELALMAWAEGELQPLRETRDLAVRCGGLTTVAVMDLSLADVALSCFDRGGCLAAAQACVHASRRYGLATTQVALLWLAGAHALAGDDEAMHAAAAQALADAPDDPRILGDLYGRVLATRSFVLDDLGALRGQLDTMMEHVRAAPAGGSIFPGRMLWATLRTIEDDDLGAAARSEYRDIGEYVVTWWDLAGDVMDAVALGRRGDRAAAHALASAAREGLRRYPQLVGMIHCQQMLIAPAAARDGWGDPAGWLREAEAFFTTGGFDRTARRCRILLGEVGAPVPRRGRGASAVPPGLRALGITSREVDVLKLVAEGRSNKEIAQRLFLSTKTVERHLSSLFDRTGLRNRAALRELATTHVLNG